MNACAEARPMQSMDCAEGNVPEAALDASEPLVLRGLVRHWPAVEQCSQSVDAAARYLSRFWTDSPVTAYAGTTAIDGRFFYNEDFSGFNFDRGKAPLSQILGKLAEAEREDRLATIYVGSTPVDGWLPGFRAHNDIRLPVPDPLASFWLGNQTRISAHFDFPDNLACVVAGERRFTLVPPDQVDNLYVGPLDPTPSGQAISLVDFADPDLTRYPRFREAARHARSAVLKPGDAIVIPSMWWHHVESLSSFNLLINYWWCTTPAAMGSPTDALMHAILSLRDLPARQREAWRRLFDHYVFDADERVYEHIPEPGRGCLSTLDEPAAKRLRATLLNRLNR
ncbi:MAG: cupin-like domain-containing protein [Gammaproteobacteria bacterium]|nr:cupin-like domain-containing protein [Gammaproteobacteria bacterium]